MKTNKLKYQFITFISASVLVLANNYIWLSYRAGVNTTIFDNTHLLIGWVLVSLSVLFMVALLFNDLIYALTLHRPHLFGLGVFGFYVITYEWLFPVNSVFATMVIITLLFTYGIKQASHYLKE